MAAIPGSSDSTPSHGDSLQVEWLLLILIFLFIVLVGFAAG
jgi:hypothetical protein